MIDPHRRRSSDPGTVDAENPWPGLAAFREADHVFFQGRDAAVDELTRMVLRARLTVLHGVSGLGKTSLLRAGLFPRLRRDHVLPIYVRLSHAEESADLVDQVRDAVVAASEAAAVEAPKYGGAVTMWEYFHRKDACFWDKRNRIVTPVIVLDQFEEIFTLGRASAVRRERSESFLAELSDLVEGRPSPAVRARLEHDPEEALRFSMSDQPCKVLLSLREDFLPDLAELRARMPTLTDTMYRLQPMTTAEALRVVEGPGKDLVDAVVAAQIVRFVASARGDTGGDGALTVVEPALLSVFCRELNNKRRALGAEKITPDLLEGNRTEIISDFYERTISEGGLSPAVRVFVEERLLTESGFRDSVAEEQALRTPGISAADVDVLIARRLLRREDAGTRGRSRLELTHDVLAEAVRTSRDRRRLREQEQRAQAERRAVEERTRREAEEAAARAQQQREFETAQAMAAKDRQAAELAQALAREEQRGREAAERVARLERRSRRRQIAWLVALLVATGSLAWFAWTRAERATVAEAEANRALSAADVDRVMRGEPWALAFLARAVRNDPKSTTARALLLGHLSEEVIQVVEMPHTEALQRATFNATGTRVLIISGAGTARLWNAKTGERVGEALGEEGHTTSAEFSPDGARVVTASRDRTAQVWDAATGRRIGGARHHDDAVNVASFDPTGRLVVTASDDQRVRIWEPEREDVIEIRAAGEPIVHASFDPTSTYLLSVSAGGDAAVWEARSGAEVSRFGLSRGQAEAVALGRFNPDGTRILALLMDGTAALVDTRTGRAVGALLQDDAPIVSAQFDPAGERVITTAVPQVPQNIGGELSAAARLWDARTGAPLPAELRHQGWINMVAFSPDGTAIVTASRDGTARVWEASSGKPIGLPLEHARPVSWAGFSPDGARVLTASEDGTAQLWDARRGVESSAVLRHDARVVSAAFSPDGASILTASADGAARLWDARTGVMAETRVHHAEGLRVERAAFSADGTLLATAGLPDPNLPEDERLRRQDEQGVARIWDVATGQSVGAPLRHTASLNTVAFGPPGSEHIVTASEDHTARLWNARTGEPVGAVMQHAGPVVSAEISADGTRIITASDDGTARVWDAKTAAPLGTPLQHPGAVLAATLHPDTKLVLTACEDGKARLWDAATGSAVAELDGHDTPIKWAAFNHDGTRILTSSSAFSLLWDTKSRRSFPNRIVHEDAFSPPVFSPDGSVVVTTPGAWVWDVGADPVVRGQLIHQGPVQSAAFSGDGRLVTTSDAMVRIWNVRTRLQAGLALRHETEVHSAVFSSDDARLLTLGDDGIGRLWDVPAARPEDAELLAELAEAIGGHEVDADGSVKHVPQQGQRLARLRERAARGSAEESSADRFLRWLFADPVTRTISPLSRITVSDYVARLLAEGDAGRREAMRLFPAHPAVTAARAGSQHSGRTATR